MVNRQGRDSSEESSEPGPEDLTEEPRVSSSQRESQEDTAPLHTAGFGNEATTDAASHRGQTSSDGEGEVDSPEVGSALRGRLNPTGGGE